MLVSIIIPCYNGAEVVDRAISSVYEQDYDKIELVVVDDGSTDNSAEVICAWKRRFEEKGWILNYVYQENKGLGGAINTGLKYVTGSYLTLLDADDEYLPGSVSKKAEFLDSHPEYAVVRSNGWVVKQDCRYPFVWEEAEKRQENIFEALLRGETCNWAGCYMVRTEALFAFYPDREIYASRYGQNLQILLPVTYRKPCGFIDEPLMNYIQQGDSMSRLADPAAAKKKVLDNAAGYRDIRHHVLNQIDLNEAEKARYRHSIDGAYWRYIMQIANMHDDTALLKEAYVSLKKEEMPTLTDRIARYRKTAPPVAFCLRVINKVQKILK